MASKIRYELDGSSVLQVLAQMNRAQAEYEQTGVKAIGHVGDAFKASSNLLLSLVDKQHQANERLTQSLEKQAAQYGKSGIEKLVAAKELHIRKLGDEKEQIDRVTAAYDKMIQKAREAEHAQEHEGGGVGARAAFLGAKDLFEGRNAYAVVELGKMATELSGIAGAAGIAAGAVIGLGAAVLETAKSLGEFAIRTRDVELRTGLSAEEVAKFSFAAKAVGQDISLVERGMRGLTMAVEDESSKGEQARKVLQGYGVDIDAVRSGTASTYEVFMKISEGLEHNTSTWQQNKDMMDLFKKVGIEILPFFVELKDQVGYFEQHGLPSPKEKEMGEWREYFRVIEAGETIVENFWRKSIVGAVNFAKSDSITSNFLRDMVPGGSLLRLAGNAIPEAPPEKEGQPFSPHVISLAQQEAESAADTQRLARYAKTKEGIEKELSAARKAETDAAKDMQAHVIGSAEAYDKAEASVRRLTQALKSLTEVDKDVFKAKPGDVQAPNRKFDPYGIAAAGGSGRIPSLAGSTLQITEQDVEDANKGMRAAQASQDRARFEGGMKRAEDDLTNRERLEKSILGYKEEMVKLTAVDESDAATKIYQLKLAASKTSLEAEEATLTYMTRQAEIQADADKKHNEEIKKQMEGLEKTSSGLFATLFNKPAQFGKELASTLHDAFLKPVTEGLGGLTAKVLHPIVYGANGDGGIAGGLKGIFGGGHSDPVKVSTDQNTSATLQNSAVLATMTAIMAGAMGMAAPSVSGGAGISIPSISTPASFGGGGGWGSNIFNGGGIGPGGTAGFAPGMLGLPGYGTSGGGTPFSVPSLAGAVGLGPVGSGGMPGSVGRGQYGTGIGGILGNFKGIGGNFGIGTADRGGLPGVDGQPGTDLGTGGTTAGSIANSAGGKSLVTAGGMYLVQRGLLGDDRGSGKGVLEGTAGGAMLGFEYGGPIGAAVGAAIGFGVGVGEVIAGVEPQWKEAQRLVQSNYGINIDHKTASQIVAIAKQSYANTVSLAVRSPEVRQMLGLYAAATGQHMPLGVGTPRAGSLAEQSGSLFQTASYQYGSPFQYQSGLPTLGPSGGNYGGGQPPVNLTLNVGNQGAGDFLAGKVVTSDFVNAQWGAAQAGSNGRTQNSALIQSPGLIVA